MNVNSETEYHGPDHGLLSAFREVSVRRGLTVISLFYYFIIGPCIFKLKSLRPLQGSRSFMSRS